MPSRYPTKKSRSKPPMRKPNKKKTNKKKSNKKTIRRKTKSKMQEARGDSKIKIKSFVYINDTFWNAGVRGRVAQVIESNKNKYAVRVNYNGQIVILERDDFDEASEAQKKSDKKDKNWSQGLTVHDKRMLYPERQRSQRSRR